MTKDKFGGDLKHPATQGKNTEATGGGAENEIKTEPVKEDKLFHSVRLEIYVSGPDSRNVDWFELISPGEGDDYEITKFDMKHMAGKVDNSTR